VPLDALLGEGAVNGAALDDQARIALATAMNHMFQSTLVVAALAFGVTLLAPREPGGSRNPQPAESAAAAD
jgi:hypothetical protein